MNGTRRERGRDLSEGSEPSRGARRTGTRLVSARVQAVAGRRRDPRVEHLATRDGLVPRRHGRGNGAGGRDASHRTCRVPRGAKSRDGFVRFLTARCPTDVAGRKREVLDLLSQPNIAYVATDQKSCAAIGRSIQLRIPVCFVTSSPCRADHLDIASTTHLYKMAAMTSTFLGSAVAAKAPVKVAAKKAVAPVASLDGLKKVRNAGNIRCSRKTYPQLLTR